MTTEELYEKMEKNINTAMSKLDKKIDSNINILGKQIKSLNSDMNSKVKILGRQIKTLKDDMNSKFNDINSKFNDINSNFNDIYSNLNDINSNLKQLNNKIDTVTNTNLAQILLNQTDFKNEINKKVTYNELEHKKLDCRITELEIQRIHF